MSWSQAVHNNNHCVCRALPYTSSSCKKESCKLDHDISVLILALWALWDVSSVLRSRRGAPVLLGERLGYHYYHISLIISGEDSAAWQNDPSKYGLAQTYESPAMCSVVIASKILLSSIFVWFLPCQILVRFTTRLWWTRTLAMIPTILQEYHLMWQKYYVTLAAK